MSAEVEDSLSNGHVNGALSDVAATPERDANGDTLVDDDEDLFGDDDDEPELEPEQ